MCRLKLWALCSMVSLLWTSATFGEQPDHHIVGLHIGIGAYTGPGATPLTLHMTTERFLLPLMAERYRVDWLPSAIDVDRQGFRDALLRLLAEARQRKADGADVTAVFMYTGHGSRVVDQNGDEEDGLDQTFVTVHGSLQDGTHDVRDDDIDAFRNALTAEGIHLTMIAEACHSETLFRGPATLNVPRGNFTIGPAERLFTDPSFDAFYTLGNQPKSEGTEPPATEGSSFVSISAATDRQLARTLRVEGVEWGVFSLAMYRTILELTGPVSYATFYETLCAHARLIDQTLSGTPQTPSLHTAGSDADRLFLARTPIPFAVRVLSGDGTRATLSAGFEAGFTEGTVVGLYDSAEALQAGSEPVTTAVVTEARIGRSSIDGRGVQSGMLSRVLTPGMADCLVYIDPGLPAEFFAALRLERDARRIILTEDPLEAMFVVQPSENQDIEVRWAREPMRGPDQPRLDPIKSLPFVASNGVWNARPVIAELSRLVRIQRLRGITHHENAIRLSWGDLQDEIEHIAFPIVVPEDGEYQVQITNHSGVPMYYHLIEIYTTDTGVLGAHVLNLNASRNLGTAQPFVRLAPATSHIHSDRVALSTGATREDITHLWLASERPMHHIDRIISPQAGHAARGEHLVLDMLESATSTRSAVRGEAGVWAARSFKFSILPADIEENPGEADAPVQPAGRESP